MLISRLNRPKLLVIYEIWTVLFCAVRLNRNTKWLGGCGNAEPVQTPLSIEEIQWSELGSLTDDPIVITPLQRGDVVYDLHGFQHS